VIYSVLTANLGKLLSNKRNFVVHVVFSKSLKSGLFGVAFIISSGAASAATININDVTAYWSSATLEYADSEGETQADGVGTNRISWGEEFKDGGQSAYIVNGVDGVVGLAPETEFVLGTFTHENRPILRPTLETAILMVEIDVEGAGIIEASFEFTHTETLNSADPCQFANDDDLTNGVGVNVNGCADQVEATVQLTSSPTVMIGGLEYFLNIVGFQIGDTPFSTFLTQENGDTTGDLIASFDPKVSSPPPPVPTPASGLLLLSAFGAAAYVKRRKAKAN